MNLQELVTYFDTHGVSLRAENGHIHYRAPSGVITPDIREALLNHKPHILELIHSGRLSDWEGTSTAGPVSDESSYPLSFSQLRLYFLDRARPDSPAYNIFRAIRLKGHIGKDILEKCFRQVLKRHHILRTVFYDIGGVPVQKINADPNFSIKEVHLDGVPETGREEAAHSLIVKETLRPFNLAAGPMIRALLINLKKNEHILLITVHHIVFDGWSISILYRELSALYNAFIENSPSPLQDLPIQYYNYAIAQNRWLETEKSERQLSFWKEYLGNINTLELPTDHPRPPVRTDSGGCHRFRLSDDLTASIHEISKTERVTPFMTLLTAFQVLLHRYTGQDDICVGTPFANRNRTDMEKLIGFFVNTMVIRTDISGNPLFRELLRKVRHKFLETYANHELPFEKVVEALNPERDMSLTPLFQVSFSFQNYPLSLPAFSGVESTKIDIEERSAKFDLEFYLEENEGKLAGTIVYNSDLFNAATIGRMAAHYRTLLERIASDPDRKLSELPIMTATELDLIFAQNDRTIIDPGSNSCVHALFEEQAAMNPDANALICGDDRLTYSELNRRANQLSHYLLKKGAGPEVPVGICMKRSIESVISIIAILKSGSAYVPLDSANPDTRLAQIAADCGIHLLVTSGEFTRRFDSSSGDIICLDRDRAALDDEETDNPYCMVQSSSLAYVVYTSGTTGVPKGVAVEHRQLSHYLAGITERLSFAGKSRFAMVTTLTADLGYTMLYGALSTGSTLHILSREQALDPEEMSRYISDHSIDYLKIVPSHLKALLTAQHPAKLIPRKMLILGGETVHSDFVAHIQGLAPECTIVNHYGPAEATIGVLTHRYEGHIITKSGNLPVGMPLADTDIYLLDAYMQPVPRGVTGEIYIGGTSLARGYMNDPDLTGEKFVPSPFSTDTAGVRLYKTGDLARYLPDGSIEFLGRTDRMVKIRGYRVELSEIESALRQQDKISDCIVTEHMDSQNNLYLAAYLLPERNASLLVSGERRYLLPNNLAVSHMNKHETDYIYSEIFERQAYMRHGIELKKGDCIVDVGANIGLFSLYADLLCGGAELYVFEPNPHIFKHLKNNASLYLKDVSLFNCGLAEREKAADFTFFPGYSLLSGFYADAEAEKDTVKSYLTGQYRAGNRDLEELVENADSILEQRFEPQVFSTTLETLSGFIDREGIQHIDLLKINAERSELDVLRGIRDEHWKRIRQIVLEVDIEDNLKPILNMLRSHGFGVTVKQEPFLEDTELHYVYAAGGNPSVKAEIGREREQEHRAGPPALPHPFIDTKQLRHQLKEQLPEYMIPSYFSILDTFPLTKNGKVDIKSLPTPSLEASDHKEIRLSPLEESMLRIWRAILNLEQMGVNDDFFDVGGHSLLAMQLVSRVRQELDIELSIVDIFDHSTVATLADAISERGTALP